MKGSTAETARKRPERPWTAARTMEVLRRCPLAIAQRLVHCAIAVSTAVLDRVTKTMSVAPLLTNNLDNSKQKTSNLLNPGPPPYTHDLFWAKVRVQLHLPPLRSLDLLISPGTLIKPPWPTRPTICLWPSLIIRDRLPSPPATNYPRPSSRT